MSDPDWAFRAGDAAILEALADGSHGASLRTYFGPQGHAALAALARLPPRAARRTARVIVVPGIMGSRLGTPQNGRSTRGMVWFDPAAIGAGRLLDLGAAAGTRTRTPRRAAVHLCAAAAADAPRGLRGRAAPVRYENCYF